MYLILNIVQIIIVISILTVFLSVLDRFKFQILNPLWRKWLWGIFCLRLLLPLPISIDSLGTVPVPEISISGSEALSDHTSKEALTNNDNTSTEQVDNITYQSVSFNIIGFLVDFRNILLGIWFVGSLFLLRLHVSQYQHVKKIYIDTAMPCKQKQIKYFQTKIQEDFRLHLCPEIIIQNNLKSPMLLGYISPKLLLPAREYTPVELELILKHELTHAKYFDQWYKLLFTIVCDIYWFVPFLSLMKKMAYEDLEYVCDARTLRDFDMESRKIYAKMILALPSQNIILSTQLVSKSSTLKKRINNIFAASNKHNIILFTVICLIFLTGNISFVYKRYDTNIPSVESEPIDDIEELDSTDLAIVESTPSESMVLAVRDKVFADIDSEILADMKERIKTANQNLEWMVMYENLFEQLGDENSDYWDNILNGGRFNAVTFMEHIRTFREYISMEELRVDFDTLILDLTTAIENHDVDAFKGVYYMIHDMDYFLFRYGPYDVGIYMQDKSTVSKYYGSLHIYK